MENILTKIKNVNKLQKDFYDLGKTKSYKFRKENLENLYNAIVEFEPKLIKAMHDDFAKSAFESYETEIGLVLEEISYHKKHLKKWMKPKRVKTSIAHFPSKGYRFPEPYGRVLIISPWNYPFQLLIDPLVGAISAGNTAILKPANYTQNTSNVIEEMINKYFPEEYIAVFKGNRDINKALLDEKYEYIFFTGSPFLGRKVMESASKNLTPVTLELGGKSPCIVHNDANVKITAQRLIWGKFLNCGQTCVAPDYLLVHTDIKEKLINEMKKVIKKYYGMDPKASDDFPRIINNKHFERLKSLIEQEEVITGAEFVKEEKYIAPTLLNNVSKDAPIMQEEIFGPVLPIIEYSNLEDEIKYINNNPRPLALYLFTKSKQIEKKVVNSINYGGGCINDTIIHLANSELPFGGIGNSGMGSYHGKESFNTLSHYKSILKRGLWLDLEIRYPPYSKTKLNLVKKLLK